jgi:hypothetical protein
MPRYIVERTFPEGVDMPKEGDRTFSIFAERNAGAGVTWMHSYVSEDARKTYCVYDAPTPEAIRKTSARNALPIDRITQVRLLDPYFYTGGV